MMRRSRAATLAGALLTLVFAPDFAFASEPDNSEAAQMAECKPIGRLKPYCGVPFPEDLEQVPGTRSVIASDMHLKMGAHGLEPQPGVLKRLDLRSGAVTPLYPAGSRNGTNTCLS